MTFTDWEEQVDPVAGITYLTRWPVGIPRYAMVRVLREEWDIPDDGPPRRTVIEVDAWTSLDDAPVRYDARGTPEPAGDDPDS